MNKKLDDIWTAINKASRNRKIIHHYSFYELALKQSKTLQLLILLQSIRSHPSTSPPSKGQVTRFVLSFVIHTHLFLLSNSSYMFAKFLLLYQFCFLNSHSLYTHSLSAIKIKSPIICLQSIFIRISMNKEALILRTSSYLL